MARAARNSSLETRTARARLRTRRTPYFAKIAKGLRLSYYRGSVSGSWVRGARRRRRHPRGRRVKVLDYWQAQDHARRWGEHQRLVAEGVIKPGSYTVANAVDDYMAESRPENRRPPAKVPSTSSMLSSVPTSAQSWSKS